MKKITVVLLVFIISGAVLCCFHRRDMFNNAIFQCKFTSSTVSEFFSKRVSNGVSLLKSAGRKEAIHNNHKESILSVAFYKYKNNIDRYFGSWEFQILSDYLIDYIFDCKDKIAYKNEISEKSEECSEVRLPIGEELLASPPVASEISFERKIFKDFIVGIYDYFYKNIIVSCEKICKFADNLGFFMESINNDPYEVSVILDEITNNNIIHGAALVNSKGDIIASVGCGNFSYEKIRSKFMPSPLVRSCGIVFSKKGDPFWMISLPAKDRSGKYDHFLIGLVLFEDIIDTFNKHKYVKIAFEDSSNTFCGKNINRLSQIKNLFDYTENNSLNSDFLYKTEFLSESVTGASKIRSFSGSFSKDLFVFVEIGLFMFE